ncbi:unnamed protein product, partial [Laminaria digitata]
DAWGRTPHPELARLYGEIDKTGGDPLKKVKRFERLLSFNVDHRESHIALAEASLAAELWGEARNHLEKAAGDDAPARVCRMMADLEERAGKNPDAVRTWLLRASNAPPDPAWICGDCGAAWGSWTPVCGNCQALGTLAWEPPARAPTLGLPRAEADDGPVIDQDDDTLLLEDEIQVDAPDDDAADRKLPESADSAGDADTKSP